MFGKWIPGPATTQLTILAGVAPSDLQKHKTNAVVTVCALLNDVKEERTENYEAEWNGFWRFFNMMQFLPSFAAVSTEGMRNLVYGEIPVMEDEDSVPAAQSRVSDQGWAEILEQIFDDDAKACASELMRLGVSPPSVVGYELLDSGGAVVAESELAWENMKIALLLPEQMESKDRFVKAGWTVFSPDDSISIEMFQGGAAG